MSKTLQVAPELAAPAAMVFAMHTVVARLRCDFPAYLSSPSFRVGAAALAMRAMGKPCPAVAASSEVGAVPRATPPRNQVTRRQLSSGIGALLLAGPLTGGVLPPAAAAVAQQDDSRQRRVQDIEKAYDKYAGRTIRY